MSTGFLDRARRQAFTDPEVCPVCRGRGRLVLAPLPVGVPLVLACPHPPVDVWIRWRQDTSGGAA